MIDVSIFSMPKVSLRGTLLLFVSATKDLTYRIRTFYVKSFYCWKFPLIKFSFKVIPTFKQSEEYVPLIINFFC